MSGVDKNITCKKRGGGGGGGGDHRRDVVLQEVSTVVT